MVEQSEKPMKMRAAPNTSLHRTPAAALPSPLSSQALGAARYLVAQTIPELVRQFREAAISKGDFHMKAKEDHRLHALMAKAFHGLQSHGEAGQAAFRSMLTDQATVVRSWVAAQMLSQGQTEARFVLEQLRKESGFLGFTAQMVLEEYRRGTLESPF